MTRKIGIIGDGHVGATVANYIVVNGLVDDLVMIDKNEAKVNADAIDFREGMPNLPFHTNITVNDYDALKDADIVISALGKIKLSNNDSDNRFAELSFNIDQVKEVAPKIRDSGFNGILIAITNPVDVITQLYQQITGLPKKHVIGTGTLLDSARMKQAVGEKLGIDSRSVTGYNLGEHGNSQFTAWSTVRALDQPITELAKSRNLDLDALDQAARYGGFTVMQGKGYTSYGIASAAVRLAKTVLSDARTVLPVSNYRSDYGVYFSYPVVVGRDGIIEDVPLDLTDEEKDKLQASADFIKKNIEKYGEK
ncbi:L-lactate dehydrogenase [Fructilactobacillus fructivorans]|uniref:L-lactate dehydrogenase n=1 Tax=Fructilactobacillus fructivorans TaxID=1614 RepID=A0A0C1PNY6_9LACO|nr:L-lactate dehydrogenase [Fructilactobacillus fructivorans]KID42477.1 L-lactate dehydrogenase [Fructilactobacillus fructivorans]MCT0151602.1 L-lactate dehydrogenase [Fructilactobacillus fructivorans]MCT2868088.1 L-lactate dehydrogenase [Fructilactobacillus fructivorans]MCT2868585.1 L-lactate dehydrogenase [Fructilactobacillus fructivorans]MCT2873789.1 L-lactate dehydrogenase [Fructilactobacillus fructivorans]